MKNKQKTILIYSNGSLNNNNNDLLNEYLDDGWIVKQIAPLGDSGNVMVLIEKEEENKNPLGFKTGVV